MKKKFTIFLFIIVICTFTSCDKYLNQQQLDIPETSEDIFSKRATTEQALYRCYNYTPKFWMITGSEDGGPWDSASDLVTVGPTTHAVANLINGSWNPTSIPYKQWRRMYQGIRDVNYFLANVDICPELTTDEKEAYKAEARFMRAYMYLYMIRLYGPVVLVGDMIIDPNTESKLLGRNTFVECVDYAASEFLAVSKILPAVQPDYWKGKATSGAALGFRSQLLLFAASPLFNTSNSIYADWKSNTTGKNLMPTTYDANKWKLAADAAKEVINMPEYSLVVKYGSNLQIDPYSSVYAVFNDQWNTELLWGRLGADKAFVQRLAPAVWPTCWGFFSPTQKLVDEFAMSNGFYPITGYSDDANGREDGLKPIIDSRANYTETGTLSFTHPWDLQTRTTFKMYVNREPRFYVNLSYNAMYMPMNVPKTGYNGSNSGVVYKVINFSRGGSSQGTTTGHPSGYGSRKMLFRDNNPSTIFTFPIWPIIRLGEVYLNYVEALIEAGDLNNPDILKYWNMIRTRAGVPNIETLYPEIIGNKALLRKYIHRERDIETLFRKSALFRCKTLANCR